MKRPKLNIIAISVAATFLSSQTFSFELLTTDIAKFYQKTYENVTRMTEAAKLLIQNKVDLEAIGESSLRTETYLLGMQQLQVDPGL